MMKKMLDMMKSMSPKTMAVVGGVLVVVVLVVIMMFSGKEGFKQMISMQDVVDEEMKEEFHDEIKTMENEYGVSTGERLMWNMSNITKNASYDVRGETTNIPKDPISYINNSGLDRNVTNERVLF